MNEIKIYDTTLRDGAQGYKISFSVEDKLLIAQKLDEFGVDYIEVGYPISNPKELEVFRELKKLKFKNSKIVAFGSTKRANTLVEDDNGLKTLIDAETEYVAIYGKSWDFHVTNIINTTLEENINMIKLSIEYLIKNNKKVIFDAEHFFDGYKSNKEYAIKVIKEAYEAGAYSICLCDTNGGTYVDEIYQITKEIYDILGNNNVELGIHCHNDSGLAVINSLKAVEVGCNQIQGTINGTGERCGNTNLSTVIPLLELKLDKRCLKIEQNLKYLKQTVEYISDISNLYNNDRMPYVGDNAFLHKGGTHIDGVRKNSKSFEHIQPELVGNERKTVISEQTGIAGIIEQIQKIEPSLTKSDEKVKNILHKLKILEYEGYQFESAQGSFELIVLKELEKYKSLFEIEDIKITINTPFDEEGSVTAVIKINYEGRRILTVGEGVGPVNALDTALRKALEDVFPELKKVQLIDYKVRVLEEKSGTEKLVRVLITSTDGEKTWTTVGVSANIVEASWKALIDSIEYKLLLDEENDKWMRQKN